MAAATASGAEEKAAVVVPDRACDQFVVHGERDADVRCYTRSAMSDAARTAPSVSTGR